MLNNKIINYTVDSQTETLTLTIHTINSPSYATTKRTFLGWTAEYTGFITLGSFSGKELKVHMQC